MFEIYWDNEYVARTADMIAAHWYAQHGYRVVGG